MMEKSINILLLEDNSNDAELIHNQVLKSGIKFQWSHVSDYDVFIEALTNFKPDLILSDYNLVGFTGLDALEVVRQKCPLVPFIIVTGTLDEETAAETIKKGAWDYVVKERLKRLSTAIKNALLLKEEKEKSAIDKEKLKISEERYKLSVEGSRDGIWDWDLKMNKTFFSSRWKSMLGYENHEIENNNNKTWETLLHPDDKEFTLSALDKHLKKETSHYEVEFRLKCKDGSYKWILARGKAMFDHNGKPFRIAGSHTDISERKIMEKKLNKAKEKAEENDKLKSAFLTNISHEIRTPINGICGFSRLLDNPQISDKKRNEYISIIIKSTDQLLNIITDIVDISKIEAGQIDIIPGKVLLNEKLLEIYSFFEPLAKEKNIELNLIKGLGDKESTINIDGSKIEQILNNLINNALKFTSQGHIKFGYSLKNNNVEFYVEDTGIGIIPQFQEKIFTRFYQIEISDEKLNEGTGLGLSISKAFVEKMGGNIWVDSKPNFGSIFYFTLPYIPIGKSSKTIKIEKKYNWKNKIILIAEDSEPCFIYLNELLSGIDVNIIHAKNGKEAVDYCKRISKIDIVLMDIKMPEMGGYKAIKIIKRLRPDLPIIAQTAYAMSDDKQKAIDAGADDYITKPISESLIIKKIINLIKNDVLMHY